MITLQELTAQVQAQLAEHDKRHPIPAEVVRDVLGKAGIEALLAQEAEGSTARRLLVRQVWITGEKWREDRLDREPFTYRRAFGPGFNAWVAGNSTGKSTIIKAIVWALTGKAPDFKADVRAWLHDVAVEVEIVGDDLYTIRYFPIPSGSNSRAGVSGRIFASDLETVLRTDAAQEPIVSFESAGAMEENIGSFFSTRLGFRSLESVDRQRYSMKISHQTVTWGVYSQALFVGADDYSDYLFPRRVSGTNPHQKTLGIYLDMDLLQALTRVQAAHMEAQLDQQFEERRVEKDASWVRQEIKRLDAELATIAARIQHVDTEQSILVDLSYADCVRQNASEATARVVDLASRLAEEDARQTQLQNELTQTQRICLELRESISFRVFLSDLTVDRCPHCEGPVPQARVEEEVRSGQCRICGSPLRPPVAVKLQEQLLAEHEAKTEVLKKNLRDVRKEQKKIGAELAKARQVRDQHQREYDDLSRQARDGFTAEMRSLVENQGHLKGQLQQLHAQSPEGQAEQLNVLRTRAQVLKSALDILETRIYEHHGDVVDLLETWTTELARSYGMTNLGQVILKDDFTMAVRQSDRSNVFQRMDIGERLRLKIAFHLSLLRLKAERRVGRHPLVLFIDAPGGAELDDHVFGAILASFTEVKTLHGDQVQIFVASTKEQLVDVCGEDATEVKDAGEYVF